MRKIYSLLLVILLFEMVSSATYYVTDPDNCPSSDGTNFPGQNCAPQDICGDSSGIAQCYDTSTISPPAGSSTTTGTGGTDYTCSDASCDGGFVTNCYATIDSGAPFCDNNGAFLIDRNSTCYNKHTQTTATGGSFASSTCSATCTTNYFQCDGSTTDADGCEIQAGASCGAGTGTIVNNQCYSASAGNCTSSTRLDCNADDTDANPSTCNGADGCEILIGGTCTVGTLSGTYGSTCTGASGTCIVAKKAFVTGNKTQYSTNATEHFLWGVDWGSVGDLINLNNSNFGIWRLNASGCVIWMDGTSTCTAPTGGAGDGTGGWTNDSINTNTTKNVNILSGANITSNWFKGKFNWTTDIFNIFDGITLSMNTTQLNNTISGWGVLVGFNSTYNSTYATWAYNQTTTTLPLSNITNPLTDVSFNFANKDLEFLFTTGASATGHFEIEGTGNFAGDLFHVHQHTGNPPANTDLVHLEATDSDVIGLNITTVGTPLIINGVAVAPWLYNQTTPAITDINSRFWNRTQTWNITQLYNLSQIDSFNASWSSTYNVTYHGVVGNASYLNSYTNVAFLNNTQTFTGQQNYSNNITINQRACFNADCSQYIYSNGTAIIIQG